MQLRSRISLAISLLLLFVTLLLGVLFAQRALAYQMRELKSKLRSLALSIAGMVDGDLHARLTRPEDMSSPFYLETRHRFLDILEHSPDIRYIYTMTRTEKPDVLRFILDAELGGTPENPLPSDFSQLGDEDPVGDVPEMLEAFSSPAVSSTIYTDRWGSFLSGFAPIRDRTGATVAILGVDIRAQTVREAQREFALYIAGACLTSLLLGILLAGMVSATIVRPIRRLTESARILGRGELEHEVRLERDDEIGFLGTTMNTMSKNLRLSMERLRTLNASARALTAALELDETLATALRLLREAAGADQAAILLLDRGELRLQTAASSGIRLTLPDALPEGFAAEVLRMKPPFVLAAEASGVQPALIRDWLTEGGLSACFPLVSKTNLRGFLLFRPTVLEPEFLEALTKQIALALENARLFNEAITDALTGLYIRRYFQIQLDIEVGKVKRYGHSCALVMADIDFFKKVNDSYGHPTGDLVLREVAAILKRSFRTVDLVCRLGGEEMAVLLPETDEAHAVAAAERARREIEKHVFPFGRPVTISMGVAEAAKDGALATGAALVEAADQALYRAKEGGRNRVVAYGGALPGPAGAPAE
ncbi:MAG: diguanylate cyclase [Planctomycetes bacterium]|nr:diguanylate cyclase [Planctomycetota bacterium]